MRPSLTLNESEPRFMPSYISLGRLSNTTYWPLSVKRTNATCLLSGLVITLSAMVLSAAMRQRNCSLAVRCRCCAQPQPRAAMPKIINSVLFTTGNSELKLIPRMMSKKFHNI